VQIHDQKIGVWCAITATRIAGAEERHFDIYFDGEYLKNAFALSNALACL
jgi:hypothetical protein